VNKTSTAFEKIGTDRLLQDHWLRRIIALIIDNIIIWIITSIISVFIVLPALIQGVPIFFTSFDLLQGLFFFLYAALFELMRGATFGKLIMNLKVTTTDGKMPTLDKTLIRNISKLHPLLLLIDTLVGMATAGDPHQKVSDRFAGTTVVSTIQRSMILPAPYAPPPPAS
jgi:uncharacterized RDD family membrane protein YckC